MIYTPYITTIALCTLNLLLALAGVQLSEGLLSMPPPTTVPPSAIEPWRRYRGPRLQGIHASEFGTGMTRRVRRELEQPGEASFSLERRVCV